MLQWILANWPTVLVTALLAGLVVYIIRTMIKDKKAGKSSCGGNCSACGMGCHCHSNTEEEK